mmetsp:Transcript_28923/g.46422  ORF Transcript_28923/g.46422 Transcript_28923/m.46422 type:complete len:372 (-) Transcript_28923:294-1409(-)
MLDSYIEISRKFLVEYQYLSKVLSLLFFKKFNNISSYAKHKFKLKLVLSKLSDICLLIIRLLSKRKIFLKNEKNLFKNINLQKKFDYFLHKDPKIRVNLNNKLSVKKKFFYYETEFEEFDLLNNLENNNDLNSLFVNLMQCNMDMIGTSFTSFLKNPVIFLSRINLISLSYGKKFATVVNDFLTTIEFYCYFFSPVFNSMILYKKSRKLYEIMTNKYQNYIYNLNKVTKTNKKLCYVKKSIDRVLKVEKISFVIKHEIIIFSFFSMHLLSMSKITKICKTLKKNKTDLVSLYEKQKKVFFEKNSSEIVESFVSLNRQKKSLNEEKTSISNPLRLPLGWDNKPIPFWLFKQHGLNEIFYCEICGFKKFYGRR